MDFGEQFDIIYSNAALHWVKDHRLLLKNSLQALKRGGRIYWNFAGEGTCAVFNSIMREIVTGSAYEAHFRDFEWPWVMLSGNAYGQMAEEAGFVHIQIIEENRDTYFADADGLVRWIDQPSLVPFIPSVPEEDRKIFRQEVIDKMIERTRQPDGTYFETFRRINICAERP